MREIKFRAWHKTRKEMLPLVDIEYLMTKGALITDYKDFVENIYPSIMQYTGLKDKNGVEIYEGDIVKTSKGILKVWYGNCAFGLVKPNKDFEDYMCNICDMMGRVYEVIGNIHEHPHLLEVLDDTK